MEHSARVYQAQGMVTVQARCDCDTALALMEARAAVFGQTLDEIADAVLERRSRFSHGDLFLRRDALAESNVCSVRSERGRGADFPRSAPKSAQT